MRFRYFPNLGLIAIYAVVVAALFVISQPALYVANEYRLKWKFERGFDLIQVGDTEQAVIKIMGHPDERNWCYPLPKDDDSPEEKLFHQQCVKKYTYTVLLENYGVTLDKDNRVSGKFHSVSP